MSAPRYFLAKFVPDLLRMEPKNIGVVVWSEGHIAARFLGEDQPDGRGVRAPLRLRVPRQKEYHQWVHYWRHQIQQPSLTRNSDGFTAPRDSSKFLDVLASKSKPASMLVEGGVVREEVAPNRLDVVVQDLFETLVVEDGDRREESAHREAEILRHEARTAFAQSGLKDRQDYHENYDWLCLVKGVQRHLKVDCVLKPDFGAEPPRALFQHVLLARQTSVMSTAFMFERAVEENRVQPEKCAALVYVTETDRNRPEFRGPLDLIGTYGAVVNLSNMTRAVEELLAIAV